MSYVVLDAEFVRSAPTLSVAQEGADDLPEIAFIGRSNVGKSSLIAELLQRRKLIKISKNPGHTRALNFFRVHARSPEGEEKRFMLVDLPGYGFARISNMERLRMSALLTGYLGDRAELAAVCQLLDLRHNPTADDRSMAAQLGTREYRHILVATKADKLPSAKRKPACRKLASTMEREEAAVTLFSASTHVGRDALWMRIWEAL